jgi:hypothetical protein
MPIQFLQGNHQGVERFKRQLGSRLRNTSSFG